MGVVTFAGMPNHFHLVLWPLADGILQAFLIELDEHLLTVMRYMERRRLRAGSVRWAEGQSS